MNDLIDPKALWAALREVIDPEIGCNIVDLGLIYSVEVENRTVRATMTLTTPGCPMHVSLAHGAEAALHGVPGVEAARVQIVWDPPWKPSMMSDAARRQLGWETS